MRGVVSNPTGLGAAAGAALGLGVAHLAVLGLRALRKVPPDPESAQKAARTEQIAGTLLRLVGSSVGALTLARPGEETGAAGGAALGVLLPETVMLALDTRPSTVGGAVVVEWGLPILGAFGGAAATPAPRALPQSVTFGMPITRAA